MRDENNLTDGLPLTFFILHPSTFILCRHVRTRFLCVWMLIRTPNPKHKVTKEVPP